MSYALHLLTLTAAAKLLPHHPHPSAIWRWARRGLRARNGSIIRLEHVRLGGKIYTTEAALEAFGKALAEADMDAEG